MDDGVRCRIMNEVGKYYSEAKMCHALRVANYAYLRVEHRCDIEESQKEAIWVAGLCHDLLEDTRMTSKDLFGLLITASDNQRMASLVVSLVEILTRKKDQTYDEYIMNIIKRNDLSFEIKAADMKDHWARVDTLTDKLINKYKKYVHYFL